MAHKANLFHAGGKVAITEFSWNATDPYGRDDDQFFLDLTETYWKNVEDFQAKNESCQAAHNVDICYAQRKWTDVDPFYWIPQ